MQELRRGSYDDGAGRSRAVARQLCECANGSRALLEELRPLEAVTLGGDDDEMSDRGDGDGHCDRDALSVRIMLWLLARMTQRLGRMMNVGRRRALVCVDQKHSSTPDATTVVNSRVPIVGRRRGVGRSTSASISREQSEGQVITVPSRASARPFIALQAARCCLATWAHRHR